MIVTVIGRGHSGTRMISNILYKSGFYMGRKINSSGDFIPPDKMYEACRIFGKFVKYSGEFEWNFQYLNECEIPSEFIEVIKEYLHDIIINSNKKKGWKLPETTLVYPWLVRLYPEIKYIYIVRDPRDNIMKRHVTDFLKDFNVPMMETKDEMCNRALSWLYQRQIVVSTPKPKFFYEVKFENLVLNPEMEIDRLADFLDSDLQNISTNREALYRYEMQDAKIYSFWIEEMKKLKYL